MKSLKRINEWFVREIKVSGFGGVILLVKVVAMTIPAVLIYKSILIPSLAEDHAESTPYLNFSSVFMHKDLNAIEQWKTPVQLSLNTITIEQDALDNDRKSERLIIKGIEERLRSVEKDSRRRSFVETFLQSKQDIWILMICGGILVIVELLQVRFPAKIK